MAAVSFNPLLRKQHIAALCSNNGIHNERDPPIFQFHSHSLYDCSIAQQAGLNGGRGNIFADGLYLTSHKVRGHHLYLRYSEGIANGQCGENRHSVYFKSGKGLNISLDAGPAAGITPGNSEHCLHGIVHWMAMVYEAVSSMPGQ